MGAIGALRVKTHLEAQGHTVLELERGSTGYKIWKGIKIKRIRVPDLLCIESGIRVESRAKIEPIITMSHTTTNADRAWDVGLDDGDYVGIVVCEKKSDDPTDWEASPLVQYAKVADLRAAKLANKVKEETPKGVQEGSESRITWPTTSAKHPSVIESISTSRVTLKQVSNDRKQSYQLSKSGKTLSPLGAVGDHLVVDQIFCSVTPVTQQISVTPIPYPDFYLNALTSAALSKRYAAAKVLSRVNTAACKIQLGQRMHDADEHIYVRLEAAASLAKLSDPDGWTFIKTCLADEQLPHRLEAVLVLSEINDPQSLRLLLATLADDDQQSDIRAGAAWALGEKQSPQALSTLIACFNEQSLDIRTEAARALLKLSAVARGDLVVAFEHADQSALSGIAWALAQSGGVSDAEALNLTASMDQRLWLAYILGIANDPESITALEALKLADPEVYFAATVLLTVLRNWVFNLKAY